MTGLPAGAAPFEMDTQVLGPAPNGQFGIAVALSEDTAAVGSLYSPRVRGATQPNTGSVYVYARGGDGWVFLQRLAPPDFAKDYSSDPNLGLSASLAISDNTLAVAAPGRRDLQGRMGAVYIFSRRNGRWIQRGTLTVNSQPYHNPFASAVALQGRTLVVGAREDNIPGHPSDGGFAYVFESFGDRWVQRAKLLSGNVPSYFRTTCVAIDGDTIAVGGSGSVHVFARNGLAWNRQAQITATNGTGFGNSVSLSGDTLAVGAPSDGNGTAYIYIRVGQRWQFEGRLTFGYRSQFGHKVVLHQGANGLEVMVSAPSYNPEQYRYDTRRQGGAHLFARTPEGWLLKQQFLAPPHASNGDRFGHAIDFKGDTAIISTPYRSSSGATYIFQRAN